jgi:hypothetical protein
MDPKNRNALSKTVAFNEKIKISKYVERLKPRWKNGTNIVIVPDIRSGFSSTQLEKNQDF